MTDRAFANQTRESWRPRNKRTTCASACTCGTNDAFTSVGSLSTKAKYNKWEVVLCSLLNLPLYLRHYFDHILLLALAQTKWLSKNGGITRILCGVDEQGQDIETEEDSINLRSEVDASQERKVTITLPDDDNPGSEFGKESMDPCHIHKSHIP